MFARLAALGIDWRAVPVLPETAPAPGVPAAHQTPEALRRRFAAPPPWAPEVALEPPYVQREPAQAAVLIAIVARCDAPTVLLTERTAHLSTHSGQIAFPGGRRDPEDADAAATALREAEEEVGLAARHVEVLGTLPVYVTGSAYAITPVVALVDAGMALRPNPGEVAEVFEVPLAFLLDPAHHRRHRLEHQQLRREWFSMPYQDGGRQRYIWGVTAGILRNFYRFMSA